MADYDMPAKDAARFGGLGGWKLMIRRFDMGTQIGVAIEAWRDDKCCRHAVRAPQGVNTEGEAIQRCIGPLTDWARQYVEET